MKCDRFEAMGSTGVSYHRFLSDTTKELAQYLATGRHLMIL